MGAVDLVLQVESPKSVARGLQRIGRAGHSVGDTSKGRIFPKFRADLLECAVVVKLHARGRDRADRRAAQRARRARPADRRDRRQRRGARGRSPSTTCTRSSRAPTPTPSCRATCWRTCSTCSTGAIPRSEFGELRPRIVWDRVAGTIRARKGARQLAVTNAGTIPDRGLFSVDAARRPPRRRARRGDGLRGARRADLPARRLDVAHRGDRARPRDRHARPRRARAPCRSGRATASGARRSSAAAIGAFSRWAVEQPAEVLERDYDLDALAARNLARLPARAAGRHARRARATARSSSSASATRSATGACACSRRTAGASTPPGASRCRGASARSYGLESDAIWSDDGIIVHLPDADEPPGADLVLIDPDELEDAVVAELGTSALFGARFRENAARSLLIPRAYPGKRTPLWQQRLKSQSLLEVARRYAAVPDHPRDLPRVPARRARPARPDRAAARAAPPRDLARRGRDADRLAVRLVAALRLRRHLHVRGRHAQRRAPRGGAVARPRPAARAARPGGAARADRPRSRSSRSRSTSSTARTARAPTTRDALADVLRRVGDLTTPRSPSACSPGSTPPRCSTQLEARAPRRAPARRRRGALDRRRRRRPVPRRASAPCRPAGCPRRSSPTSRRRWRSSSRATRAPTARSPPASCASATASTRPARCASSSARASSSAASCGPAGSEREWCDPEVLRRLRRASLAVAAQGDRGRRPARAGARFLPSWQGVDRHPPRRRRRRPPARGARAAAGPRAARRRVGARRAAAPLRRLLAHLAGPAVRQRRGRVGRRGRARAQLRAASRCTSATTPRPSGRRPSKSERAGRARARAAARAPRAGAVLLHRPAGRARDLARGRSRRRSGTSCGPAR